MTHLMPTKVIWGRNCVLESANEFKNLGTHALIVTGKSSAKCGALADVTAALNANGQNWTVFDEVTPNPNVDCLMKGTERLSASGADFVIGLGGGSPMDAAKAIAMLAVQPRRAEDVLSGGYEAKALPMAHIPTTAGTGSEVTPYAIITDDVHETKTNISSSAMFPRVAFLDGKYMAKLPREITVNTALDALSHAIEGILSRTATPLSDLYACGALSRIYPILFRTHCDILTLEERDMLLLASSLAGMTIAQSGTTAVHAMGYCLTYFFGVDHGRANALLLGETLRLCKEKELPQLPRILVACGCSLDELLATIDLLLGKREKFPRETLREFARRTSEGSKPKKSAYEPSRAEIERIFLRSCGE